jgi:3-phenylpropionate/trans-cinnamate dioxygenase ferredoxin reductase subunit
MSTVIIVGAGQAGGETALALRQQGYGGRIVLIGDEAHPPYRRPPLSKTYLSGQVGEAALLLRSADAYATASIELMLGRQVEAIDRHAQRCTATRGSISRPAWRSAALNFATARWLPCWRANALSLRTR